MNKGLKIVFFGSTLVSTYWNRAATYYRGIIRALNRQGHSITFFEPDIYQHHEHRDISDPFWARVVVYAADDEQGVYRALQRAADADLIIKTGGVGVFDDLLEAAVLDLQSPRRLVAFWDVDPTATLARLYRLPADPFRQLIPRYDLILTYGGGEPVIKGYKALGAQDCVPIYNAIDPITHHPVTPDPVYQGILGFLGNRTPDREERVENFFFKAAEALPDERFLLGGNGWADAAMPDNVDYLGHIYTRAHNAFNCTPQAVLNISRKSTARYGFSPSARIFEAAAAGACLITDAWAGIEMFLTPGEEVLVARDSAEVVERLQALTREEAQGIGRAALRRTLAEHTYAHRATQLETVLDAQPVSVMSGLR